MRIRVTSDDPQKARVYKDRGITICDRWQSFASFLADMGPRPSPAHTIDRLDNALGYQPGNCRWATAKEQGQNRRDNIAVTHDGRTQTVELWAEETGITKAALYHRIERGWLVERALFTPVRGTKAA